MLKQTGETAESAFSIEAHIVNMETEFVGKKKDEDKKEEEDKKKNATDIKDKEQLGGIPGLAGGTDNILGAAREIGDDDDEEKQKCSINPEDVETYMEAFNDFDHNQDGHISTRARIGSFSFRLDHLFSFLSNFKTVLICFPKKCLMFYYHFDIESSNHKIFNQELHLAFRRA